MADAALKSFYYQRTGMPIEATYAGRWSRPAGHPDDKVLVHPNAAGPERKAGAVISSPGGWYDAGDYNKYIVNSAYSIGLMQAIYARFPDYFIRQRVNIPESGNHTPDLLDEMYYNLKWMLTMQDPADGGVYHKLTTPSFEGFIKPTECKQPRYVVQKSVTAALDYLCGFGAGFRVVCSLRRGLSWLFGSGFAGCRTCLCLGRSTSAGTLSSGSSQQAISTCRSYGSLW